MSASCGCTGGVSGIWSCVESQFGHPRGLLGGLVGRAMALEHRGQADWVIEALGIECQDRVLEIGFGPGLAVQKIAAIVREGFVAGVDISDVMVQQARRRNAAAIRDGRVRLSLGSVEALPYEDNSFDKALAINTFHHWQDPDVALREVWRVLKPGAVFAVAERPHAHSSGAADAGRREQEGLAERLTAAGFKQVSVKFQTESADSRFCMLAVK